MKRDMELIRKLLLIVESLPDEWDVGDSLDLDVSSSTVRGHLEILQEAGYLDIKISSFVGGGYSINKIRLTWKGHEFLDAVRSETIWKETKEAVTKTGGGMVVSVVKSVATKLLTDLAMGNIP